jgi:hypothetical protein
VAQERHPPPEQVPGGAHPGGVDIGLGEHAAAPQDGDLVRIEPSMLGLAPVDGLHGEGVAQHEGKALAGTQVGRPGPR